MSARTNIKSPTQTNVSTPVVFHFEMIEVGGRFLVDRVTATFEIEPGKAQVLEIAPGRLFS